jgi:hypothetical protein
MREVASAANWEDDEHYRSVPIWVMSGRRASTPPAKSAAKSALALCTRTPDAEGRKFKV